MAKQIHPGPHKYRVVDYGKNGAKIARCILPNCPHFLPDLNLMVGRVSICFGCGEEFLLSDYHRKFQIQKPTCFECRSIKGEKMKEIRESRL